MKINIGGSYDVVIERGCLFDLHRYTDLSRKVMIVTDSGVPRSYLGIASAQCRQGSSFVMPQGEESKSLGTVEQLCKRMLDLGFDRGDLVIALGGGVVCDTAGFAASCYMRGIDFISIPTTALAQIDASVGGKTAVNLNGVKNAVGSFYDPKIVLIDPDVLKTLPRQVYAQGLAEAVKMALICDPELFGLLEKGGDICGIIAAAVRDKAAFVAKDRLDKGDRAALNLGHTIGHAIEGAIGLPHGQSVALGMLPMIEDQALKGRVRELFASMGLETSISFGEGRKKVLRLIKNDKKARDGYVTVVKVPCLGSFRLERTPLSQLEQYIGEGIS